MSGSSIRIGTSGYTYSWNERRPSPFKWYINQGLNSVEINASYYRFPKEILTCVKDLDAEKKAIYLNNDHGVLQSGLYLLKRMQ
ncbi:MAG: hypothetical protein WBX01_03810 [Nitrososphaeraceae archaeon]